MNYLLIGCFFGDPNCTARGYSKCRGGEETKGKGHNEGWLQGESSSLVQVTDIWWQPAPNGKPTLALRVPTRRICVGNLGKTNNPNGPRLPTCFCYVRTSGSRRIHMCSDVWRSPRSTAVRPFPVCTTRQTAAEDRHRATKWMFSWLWIRSGYLFSNRGQLMDDGQGLALPRTKLSIVSNVI